MLSIFCLWVFLLCGYFFKQKLTIFFPPHPHIIRTSENSAALFHVSANASLGIACSHCSQPQHGLNSKCWEALSCSLSLSRNAFPPHLIFANAILSLFSFLWEVEGKENKRQKIGRLRGEPRLYSRSLQFHYNSCMALRLLPSLSSEGLNLFIWRYPF